VMVKWADGTGRYFLILYLLPKIPNFVPCNLYILRCADQSTGIIFLIRYLEMEQLTSTFSTVLAAVSQSRYVPCTYLHTYTNKFF